MFANVLYYCSSMPSQVYEPGKGLGFHFDKDEHVMRSQGKMLNPLWSSVLYLTGSTEPAAAAAADCSNGNGNSSSYGQTDCSCEGGEAGGAAAAGDAAAAVDDWDGVRQGERRLQQRCAAAHVLLLFSRVKALGIQHRAAVPCRVLAANIYAAVSAVALCHIFDSSAGSACVSAIDDCCCVGMCVAQPHCTCRCLPSKPTTV
jgi:hypothetical protein